MISRLKNNPIARAVRCDKWTISFLDEALRSFVDDGPSKNNLTNLLLTTSRKSLKKKGEKVLSLLTKKKIKDLAISLVNSEVEVGSGSLPLEKLDSMALEFKPKNISTTKLSLKFRTASIPTVGYINGNKFYIDLKTIIPGQEEKLAGVIIDL